jgi:hypothetical protein
MQFTARLDFSYGRCSLTFDLEGNKTQITAYHLHRSFEELVHAVAELATGVPTSSCRWVSGERAGGVFIDFVADPADGINVAVQEFRYDEASTKHEEIWNAGRGTIIWEARIARADFLFGFVIALRRAKVLYSDDTGFMSEWGWLFPERDFDRIASITQRLGYPPVSTKEIRRLG